MFYSLENYSYEEEKTREKQQKYRKIFNDLKIKESKAKKNIRIYNVLFVSNRTDNDNGRVMMVCITFDASQTQICLHDSYL